MEFFFYIFEAQTRYSEMTYISKPAGKTFGDLDYVERVIRLSVVINVFPGSKLNGSGSE
jgi:hypothetical protein